MWLWPKVGFKPPLKDTGEDFPNAATQEMDFKTHFRCIGFWDGSGVRLVKCTKTGIITVVPPRVIRSLLITATAGTYIKQLPYLACSQVLIRSPVQNTGYCDVYPFGKGVSGESFRLWSGEWVKIGVDNLAAITVVIQTTDNVLQVLVEGI